MSLGGRREVTTQEGARVREKLASSIRYWIRCVRLQPQLLVSVCGQRGCAFEGGIESKLPEASFPPRSQTESILQLREREEWLKSLFSLF